jgi:hypothetical protein
MHEAYQGEPWRSSTGVDVLVISGCCVRLTAVVVPGQGGLLGLCQVTG